MRFDIITIFPEIFDSYLNESILGRAQKEKLIEIKTYNLRQFSTDKHKKIDDKPYGGGAGMVLMAQPIIKAVQSIESKVKRKSASRRTKVIIFSAKGKPFNQKMAYNWVKKYKNFIFINGRYEGIDERVWQILKAQEISIGPYVLLDGDVAAMVVISALARLIPGAINWESLQEESYFNRLTKEETKRGLRGVEYPHYTRPETILYKGKKYKVPRVLLSGNHQKIAQWRKGKIG